MKAAFSPSLMCMDFLKIREQLEVMNQHVDMYHIDIMDGHYCKNIALSPYMVETFAKVAKKPMDCHLMTTNPTDWIEVLAKAGAAYISPHAETINTDAFRIIHLIKSFGCKIGVVLNPATPLSYIKHYINRIDLLTIMSVDVGFASQPFVDEMLDKIREAKQMREENGYSYRIQIDGSCNKSNYKCLTEAGGEIFVVGNSGLFDLDENMNSACEKMFEEYQKSLS